MMNDYLFRGTLHDLDPDVQQLIEVENERQYRKLILIPSESTAPGAVLEALGSRFQNIYAEGYPDEDSRYLSPDEILDYDTRLAHYRRYSDPRYYKGVEYADAAEALARRRCAEAFATDRLSADQIFVNVQALSGAPANNAVYHALVNPGDTVMGMNLLFGGHLTHGSPVNRSGKYYNIVPYTINPDTEKIDMDQVERLAQEHKPKMIIVGYSSYPWAADFKRFREVADSVGAYLLADMAHVAGLIAGGVYPSPLGYAHVVTFTTHKTLNGPRGACILTTDPALARRIDRAVFPGEQGGPHVNVFAALSVAFKIARTPEFRQLQAQTVKNAVAMSDRLKEHGFRIPFGGTESHLLNIDCKSVKGPDGTPLMGDLAARILDIAGIVVNRNTIPGDRSALHPSGVRLGTPWITQRGFTETETRALADCIAQVLQGCKPYQYRGHRGLLHRAKVDFTALHEAKVKVRDLAQEAGIDFEPPEHGYPHFYYYDEKAKAAKDGYRTLEIEGPQAATFLQYATTNNVLALGVEESQKTQVLNPDPQTSDSKPTEAVLTRPGERPDLFHLTLPAETTPWAAAWLRDLSDGYVEFEPADLHGKVPGPVVVRDLGPASQMPEAEAGTFDAAWPGVQVDKPYFVGLTARRADLPQHPALPEFEWHEPADAPLKKTRLNETHRALGGRMVPFAGWEMPVQYTGVVEEHLACRQAAGLFDVSHMGVWEAAGPTAAAFLDSVCGNDVAALAVGESLYSHLLDPDANVHDDLMVYRRGPEQFLIVVNASNDDKDWAWVNAVQRGEVRVDGDRPWATAFGRGGVRLRNLRDPQAGADQRVDIALQGPRSRDILLALGADAATAARIKKLARTELGEAQVGGFDLVVSRTGYTGEPMAFELFVHPNRAVDLWNALLKAGEPLGLKPCGLAARDSLRTEAGLPLYGHEMGGEKNLGVGEAGFGSYVHTNKPWFIGRSAYLRRERERAGEVARFRFNKKGVRVAHPGDPVVDDRGRVIGFVTSCSIDSEGFLSGQAYLEQKYTAEGSALGIFQSASAKAEKPKAELKPGDRVTLAEPATVLSRFPKKK